MEGVKWITLGRTQISVDYLTSVSQTEAVENLVTENIHKNRVINAWKQANNYKSPNVKKKKA